jgi:hypothetical protein
MPSSVLPILAQNCSMSIIYLQLIVDCHSQNQALHDAELFQRHCFKTYQPWISLDDDKIDICYWAKDGPI